MFLVVHFCILSGLCNIGREVQLNMLGAAGMKRGIKAKEYFFLKMGLSKDGFLVFEIDIACKTWG